MAKLKFKIEKNKIQFSKNKAKLTEPIHRVCEICKDDGKCLNNETHKDYEKNNEDFFGTDYWDCVSYEEKKNDSVGYTMMNWMKNLQEKEKKNQCEGGFKQWSKQFK